MESHAVDAAEFRLVRGSVLAAESFFSCASNDRGHAGPRVNSEHAIVPGVGDQHIATGQEGEAVRPVEAATSRSVVSKAKRSDLLEKPSGHLQQAVAGHFNYIVGARLVEI